MIEKPNPSNKAFAVATWAAAAALVLGGACAMTVLSHEFVFGVDHAGRPIPLFLGIYAAMWLGFAAACVLVWRGHGPRTRWGLAFLVLTGLAARAVLMPSNLIQENDCYRYVLDGEACLHGVNPFRYAPGEVEQEAPEPFRSALKTERGQAILEWVSYKHIPTIYPPLGQAAFAMGAAITPWHWMGQRIVFAGFDLATLAVLFALLRRMARGPAWLVFYAWNPLILKEIVNAAHLDSSAALMIVLLVACLVRWREHPSPLWAALAGLALAGAVLAKLYPVLLAPLCAAYLLRAGEAAARQRISALALFSGAAGLAIAAAYAPFTTVGLARMTEGLRTYGAEWQRNDGAFRVLQWALEGGPVTPRMAVAGIVGAFALGASLWLMQRAPREPRPEKELVAAIQATLLCWFLFLPAAYPWYATALLAVSTLRPRPWSVVMSGALAMYYLLFMYSYRDYPEGWKPATQAVEHGLIWLALLGPAAHAAVRRWIAQEGG